MTQSHKICEQADLEEVARPSVVVGCRGCGREDMAASGGSQLLTEWAGLGAGEGRCDFPELTTCVPRLGGIPQDNRSEEGFSNHDRG